MAELAIAAVGAGIGWAVGETLLAAQIGWAIGSFVGAQLFAKDVTVESPMLNDLRVTGVDYGQPIPRVYGKPRVAGQIWWASDKRPIRHESEGSGGGKGGGGKVTQVYYTYDVDLLIGLSDNITDGVTKVWSNGKLVYNVSSDADAATIAASQATTEWTRITVYDGSVTQLPDPTYEAAVGVGNAPAYRNRTSVFLQDLHLGTSGQIPNLTFQVEATNGGIIESYAVSVDHFANTLNVWDVSDRTAIVEAGSVSTGSDPYRVIVDGDYAYVLTDGAETLEVYDISDKTAPVQIASVATLRFAHGLAFAANHDYLCVAGYDAALTAAQFRTIDVSDPTTPTTLATITLEASGYAPEDIAVQGSYAYVCLARTPTSRVRIIDISNLSSPTAVGVVTTGDNTISIDVSGSYAYAVDLYGTNNFKVIDVSTPTLPTVQANLQLSPYSPPLTEYPYDCKFDGNSHVHCVSNNRSAIRHVDVSTPTAPFVAGSTDIPNSMTPYTIEIVGNYAYIGGESGGPGNEITVFDISAGSSATLMDTVGSGDIFGIGFVSTSEQLLSTTVADLCDASGLSAAQYDVTDLQSVARPVRGLATSQLGSTRAVLELLASAFYFEMTVSDKLYFYLRGGASAATIPYDDLGASERATSEDPFTIKQGADLEMTAQVAINYPCINQDYQLDVQYSDRLVSTQAGTVIESKVPLGLTETEAKTLAEITLQEMIVSNRVSTIRVLGDYARLEPTDVITVTDYDDTQYRMRIVKREDAWPLVGFDLVMDDTASLVGSGITSAAAGSVTTVSGSVTTELLTEIVETFTF